MINNNLKDEIIVDIIINEVSKEIKLPKKSTLQTLRNYILNNELKQQKNFDIFFEKFHLPDFYDFMLIIEIFDIFKIESKKKQFIIIPQNLNNYNPLNQIEKYSLNELKEKEKELQIVNLKLLEEEKILNETTASYLKLEKKLNNNINEMNQKENEINQVNEIFNKKSEENERKYDEMNEKNQIFEKLLHKIIINKMMEKQAICLIQDNKKLVSKLHWSVIELEHKKREQKDLEVKHQNLIKKMENENKLIENYLSKKKNII